MATFVGSSQGGVLGAFLATLGVVLPSFIIILLIASLIRNFLKYKGVQAFLGGIRPCVVGLILTTALTMFLSTLLDFRHIGNAIEINISGLVILAVIVAVDVIFKKIRKKPLSPIILILVSAGLGMLIYS
jgi:chromate transporter